MSTEWDTLPHVTFDALVEPLVWGRATYVIARLPDALAEAAVAAGTRRAEGTLEGFETVAVNVGINRADVVPAAFLYVGRPLVRRLGVSAGDLLHGSLRPADPDLVPLDAAATEATRLKRLQALIRDL